MIKPWSTVLFITLQLSGDGGGGAGSTTVLCGKAWEFRLGEETWAADVAPGENERYSGCQTSLSFGLFRGIQGDKKKKCSAAVGKFVEADLFFFWIKAIIIIF